MGRYIWRAFNARPIGMPIPPNWLGIAAFGLLGFANPGFWLIGAGLEVAYLAACIKSPRFRRVVDSVGAAEKSLRSEERLRRAMDRLSPSEASRFLALDERCRLAIEGPAGSVREWDGVMAESLARLRWAYVHLLTMRRAVADVIENESGGVSDRRSLTDQVSAVEARLAEAGMGSEVRRSLESQRDVLAARLEARREARERLEQVDAELGRIEAHVELLREQSLLATGPQAASASVDAVATSVRGTARWIREHQAIDLVIEDELDEPPPMAARPV